MAPVCMTMLANILRVRPSRIIAVPLHGVAMRHLTATSIVIPVKENIVATRCKVSMWEAIVALWITDVNFQRHRQSDPIVAELVMKTQQQQHGSIFAKA